MPARSATVSRGRGRSDRRAKKYARRRDAYVRRRGFAILVILALIGGLAYAAVQVGQKGYQELALPLRHDDIIRQQAQAKDLDPALIAAVIYQESRFRPRESSAGALGLMQLLPDTAHFIAGKTGGTRFTTEDLATPQINIQYGAWYLRYLLNHFDGDEVTALAAYNAGIGTVQGWLANSGETAIRDVNDIPYPETREYVKNVMSAQAQYRKQRAKELGL